MMIILRSLLLRCMILSLLLVMSGNVFSMDSLAYELEIRPLLSTKCFRCHNTGNPKGGVNLDNYKEVARVIKDGQFWLKVLGTIKTREMPPKSEPALSEDEYHKLVTGINDVLQSSLAQRRPGQIVIRRLSHSEYRYTVLDLMQVDFDAKNYFPSDGSGGGGFDNQGRALFFTPLKLERYYDAADKIVEEGISNPEKWEALVPFSYKQNWWQRFRNWVKSIFSDDYEVVNPPSLAAEKVIFPFATKAFRRFLKEDEKTKLLGLFQTVYAQKDSIDDPQRFNESIAQTFKAVLVSPNFLYRSEEEPERNDVYALSDFEVATRLSYFLWSSMPDDELFNLAYQGKLQDTLVLETQVRRMLADPKSKRFAENFSTQWLGITKLTDNQPLLDPEKYPGFDMPIRKALYTETVEYFYYVLTKSKKMLELINSNYTFLNKELAEYYGIEGVNTIGLEKVILNDSSRGGVLGMGSVLSTTSFPLRTSPVTRGKWVMEQLLGISPPPPPPVVAELTEDKTKHEEVGLRRILEMHRASPECNSCHVKMDPLGLGLENFDPMGKWRTTYGKAAVDPSGVMADGRTFRGPAELKSILTTEKEKIARNFSARMLSYALGRSVIFTDEPALQRLDETLLKTNFNPEDFLIELVKSYPFRMKVNDFEEKV
jgi:uncharacterized protein DUF1592/uncharacterized protein DUF1588/uncharacterized protein DUF1587/uncharacterized protein DUF1585/uncharacterized protein DUF1595/cytochrome c